MSVRDYPKALFITNSYFQYIFLLSSFYYCKELKAKLLTATLDFYSSQRLNRLSRYARFTYLCWGMVGDYSFINLSTFTHPPYVYIFFLLFFPLWYSKLVFINSRFFLLYLSFFACDSSLTSTVFSFLLITTKLSKLAPSCPF